jgi:hypothetical protein
MEAAGFRNCLFNVFFLSSGSQLFWGNTAPVVNASAGSGYQWLISMHSMRRDNSTYAQTVAPNGWGYCGTSFNGTGSNWDQNANASTGYSCLDQPGRGKGDLLANDFPSAINTATGTVAWPHQALEPVYEWLDSLTPVPNNPGGTMITIVPTFLCKTGIITSTLPVSTGRAASAPGPWLPVRPLARRALPTGPRIQTHFINVRPQIPGRHTIRPTRIPTRSLRELLPRPPPLLQTSRWSCTNSNFGPLELTGASFGPPASELGISLPLQDPLPSLQSATLLFAEMLS